jgi:phosphoglycerate dehydrogenase-like enzyme
MSGANMASHPTILVQPHPRTIPLIFSDADKSRLEKLGHVHYIDQTNSDQQYVDCKLDTLVALIGQVPMDRQRLERAPRLRAIFNVEGNFLPNIDYDYCLQRNIHVLACAPAFSQGVAEMALGMAICCARGIVEHDAKFRAGQEVYGGASNSESFLVRGKTIGLLGCGNVGRALLPLLKPFVSASGTILAHDPWIHERVLSELGTKPVSQEELLQRSDVLFIISAASTENTRALTEEHFMKMQRGSVVIVVGRSEVLDFDGLLHAAESGHLKVAVDVFPQEPLARDHQARRTRNTILSAHRAGGLPETYREIGRMVADDLELILRGLPPQRMQRAIPETVGRYRGKPVGATLKSGTLSHVL